MYFLTALGCTIISGILWIILKNKKYLHLEILTLIFLASSLMWLVDCIFTCAKGEGFLSFSIPIDCWISFATVIIAIALWIIISLIINKKSGHKIKNG